MLFKKPPKDFNPIYETVSCFCEHQGEILLLKRQDSKSEGNKWGIPAGRIEDRETKDVAILREILEETGWSLKAQNVYYLLPVFVRYDDHDFIFHMYKTKLNSKMPVKIQSEEHKEFSWTDPKSALSLDLVKDFDKCIKIAFNLK